LERFFVNIPYSILLARCEEVVARGLNPEIVLDASVLDNLDKAEAHQLAKSLDEKGLENTLHGPFRDLSPGGVDPKVLAVTRERIDQTIGVAEIFRAKRVVFHSGYDPWRYQGYEHLWVQNSMETWKPFVLKAERIRTTLAIENVFEKTPVTLLSLLERIGSPHFRHCLDVGHLNVFGDTPPNQWVEAMVAYIVEIHLHDNNADNDDHLPLGEGNIEFPILFRLIRRYLGDKPIYSLEPNREEDLEPSIEGFLRLMKDSKA
jgi:sugar phosphate isomerase/epimerase